MIPLLVAPYGLTKRYPFRLDHEFAAFGVSLTGSAIPALRIQPRAQFIHSVGPEYAVEWCRGVASSLFPDVRLGVSRLDLFADWQGWPLREADHDRFVTRARQRTSYAEDDVFTGFTFGRRRTATISCRIYKKTRDAKKKGVTYWPDVWCAAFDPREDVWRVEFECNRRLLHDFKLVGPPEQVLAARGDLWEYATDWLSLRDRVADTTRSRWPIAPEWERVRAAELRNVAIGAERMRERQGEAELDRLLPGLVGYLSSVGRFLRRESLADVIASLAPLIRAYDTRTERSFESRVAAKLALVLPR
jgi:hypothetical protein